MKSYTDRLWLVLLGVAVAIVVTMTTIYWSKPTQPRSGADLTPVATPSPQALLPKLGTDMARFLKIATHSASHISK